MKTYLNKPVKVSKQITKKVTCDVCGKTIADEKNNSANYWELVTHHNDWGNDSCESYEDFDLCSKDCVQEKLNEYFDNCEDSDTQQFELSQATICIDILALKMAVDNNKESIPYLMHKEIDIPISECQKAYDIAIDYLRSQGKLKG